MTTSSSIVLLCRIRIGLVITFGTLFRSFNIKSLLPAECPFRAFGWISALFIWAPTLRELSLFVWKPKCSLRLMEIHLFANLFEVYRYCFNKSWFLQNRLRTWKMPKFEINPKTEWNLTLFLESWTSFAKKYSVSFYKVKIIVKKKLHFCFDHRQPPKLKGPIVRWPLFSKTYSILHLENNEFTENVSLHFIFNAFFSFLLFNLRMLRFNLF